MCRGESSEKNITSTPAVNVAIFFGIHVVSQVPPLAQGADSEQVRALQQRKADYHFDMTVPVCPNGANGLFHVLDPVSFRPARPRRRT